MPAKANKATKKKPVKKAPPDLCPKELIVESTNRVTEITIKSPLNIKLRVSLDSDGNVDYVLAGKVNNNKISYICDDGLTSMIENVLGYSDEQFADLLSVVNAARALYKENRKK